MFCVFFSQILSVSNIMLFLPENEVLLHSALRTPSHFFWSLKSFGPTEKSEVDLRHSIQDLFSVMFIGLVHLVSVRSINNSG